MKLPNYKTVAALVLLGAAYIVEAQAATPPDPAQDTQAELTEANLPEVLLHFQENFDINSDVIQTNPQLTRLSQEVDSVLRQDTVTSVRVRGYASIDGPVWLNKKLARERAKAIYTWLEHTTSIDPSLIQVTSNGEDWNMFDSLVTANPNIPMRQEVLDIIKSNRSIQVKQQMLKTLGGGAPWDYMAVHTFHEMRVTEVTIGGYRRFINLEKEPEEVVEVEEVVVAEEPIVVIEEPMEPEPEPEYWTRKLYVKTNAPAWLCLWINAAVEIDLAEHWSANLPIYYSGFNYFTRKVKFRTFSVVPEVRYWLRPDNMGFFVNGHLGMNLFNYAKGGDYRYQTWHGHSPALGGGVGLGYRWYFCGNHRWSMEAAVGAGVYHLDYSIFENVPNGLIVGRKIRTFFGIDQAALSFVYSFGVERKEVKQ